MRDKSIIIWAPSGLTMKFEKVKEVRIEEGELRFTYFGVSTQEQRAGRFNMDHILGWSIS